MKEASFYRKSGEDVICLLCPHACSLKPGQTGLCGARGNTGGKLFALSYGKLTAMNLDPVEKKPLLKFMPGTYTLSLGSFGCNLACPFCQNHSISKGRPGFSRAVPEEIVNVAISRGIPSISYTYNEPSTYYEFMLETATLSRGAALKNIMVTNGYIESEPFARLLPYLDAINIDLKAMSEEGYNRLGGSLNPVLRTIETAAAHTHVEITMLLVPGFNCDMSAIVRAAKYLARINPDIPLHLSRYFPAYQYSKPATDPEFVLAAARSAREYLPNVYCGNLG